ncbi:unnamed protein product [Rotaria magnacalcarata]|uniref:Uncharacterized protein n=1 Tax=Rotaria magnacalcarata TaxID=392030 RepID=A0A814E1H6_9BILA|nr:unnamed protein product [Rotaria magnacalcarata]
MLTRLPFDELRALLPKLKDRILFNEKRDILIKEWSNGANEQLESRNALNECNKQTVDICSESQITTATQYFLAGALPPSDVMDNETIGTTLHIDSQANEDEHDDLEEKQQKLPLDFEFASLPKEIQIVVDENELTKLRGHTNHRRIPITDENAENEWREAIKQKFKNERRLFHKTSSLVKRQKEKFGKGSGRPAKKCEVLSAERKHEKLIYVSTIMNECDLEQLVITMKEGIENTTIDNDELNILWKKTFGYRRSYIRSHTTNEVLERFPGYSYPILIFEEVKMTDNVDIEQNVNEILPHALPIRTVKLLSKQFAQSVSQVLVDKEPIVPTPCIKISNENFQLYLDWQFAVETTNPTTALALLFSLYNVFEVKFTKNNHTAHLLYGVIFENGDQLGKNLRILLNSWGFTYTDRTKESQMRTANFVYYVNTETTQQVQLHSRATTIDNVYLSTISKTSISEQPQLSQSTSLTIIDQRQQLHHQSFIQIDEPEPMDIVTEIPHSSAVHSEIQQTPDIKNNLNDSSYTEDRALKDVTNREKSTASTKGEKRKLPTSPKPRKFSSRLASKRSRQNVSSFPL